MSNFTEYITLELQYNAVTRMITIVDNTKGCGRIIGSFVASSDMDNVDVKNLLLLILANGIEYKIDSYLEEYLK